MVATNSHFTNLMQKLKSADFFLFFFERKDLEEFFFLAQTGSWQRATLREPKINIQLGQMLATMKNKQSSAHLPLLTLQSHCLSKLLGGHFDGVLGRKYFGILTLRLRDQLIRSAQYNWKTTSTTLFLLPTGKSLANYTLVLELDMSLSMIDYHHYQLSLLNIDYCLLNISGNCDINDALFVANWKVSL